MAAFLPLFYLPVSSIIPLILSFAPVSGGPCHFRENNLSPYSGKPVGISTKTQYYFSYQIMVEKILICSYIEHLEDDLVLRNLKIGILGLRYKDIDCLAYPQAGFLIALFQTLAVLVVLWGMQVIGVFDISIHLPHLHSQFLPCKILSQLLWCWLITELL